MSALIGNPLLLTSAPAASDDAYQIKNSLRFDAEGDPNLKKTIATKGNRRKWTYSCWLKNCITNSGWWLIGKGNTYFQVAVDGTQSWIRANQRTNGGNTWWDSGRKMNDNGAWYNIVIAVDYCQSNNADKIKLYINGKLDPAAGGALGKNYVSIDTELLINEPGDHYIGSNSNPDGGGGYLTDVYFIDGLQLSPAAFGSFDSTGVWNPKEFSLPNPNNGTTWSNNGDNTNINSSYPWTKAFDGLADGTYGNGAGADDGDGWARWTPTDGITVNALLRINTDNGTSAVKVKFSSGTNTSVQHLRELTDGWNDVEGTGKLEYIEIYNSGSDWSYLCGVEIDGNILVDGLTDATTRKNPNDGAVWSSLGTLTNYSNAVNAFDGKVRPWSTTHGDPTMATGSANSTWTWDLGSTNKITEVQTIGLHIWPSSNQSGNNLVKINGTDVSADLLQYGEKWVWHEFSQFTEFEKLEVANNYWYLAGVTINGHLLIDSSNDNSFGLNFSDTSLIRYLGKDTLNSKLEGATGGKPILTVTDAYGDATAGAVDTSDANKSNIVLAMPGNTLTDVHHTVKGSGSAKSITNDGVVVSTDDSRYYGSSLLFDSNRNDDLTITGDSDFAFGTGDFCVEFWVNNKGNTNYHNYLATRSANAAEDGWCIATNASGVLYAHSNGAMAGSYSGEHFLPLNQWCHVAYTRAGGTHRLFLNGVMANTASTTSRDYTNDDLTIGTNPWGPEPGTIYSYMQDIRIYKGAAKYTANFTPPIRNNWTANGLKNVGGTPYSSYWGGTGSSSGADVENRGNSFDGNTSTYTNNAQSGTIVNWVPPSGIAYTDLEVKFGAISTGNNQVYINGNVQNVTNAGGQTYTDSNGTLTSVGVQDTGGSHGRIFYIKIDGEYLVDGGAYELDCYTDSPTNYTDTSDVVHGNYCTLNPLEIIDNSGSQTHKQGNLYVEGTSSAGAWHKGRSTFAIPKGDTGKWYYEAEVRAKGSAISYHIGWDDPTDHVIFAGGMGDSGKVSWCYRTWDGKKRTGGTDTTYGEAIDTGDILGVGYDNGSIYFWKNGTIQDSGTAAFTGVNAILTPTYSIYTESNAVGKLIFNFGQRPFKHPQSGYKGYCTKNLDNLFDSETSENNPSKYFDVKTWIGTGSAGHDITGFNFQPDLVWLKRRDSAGGHHLRDANRGATKSVFSNTNEAEGTDANIMSAFTSDGFTLGNGDNTNGSDGTYVGWAWDAGTAGAANNDGSINVTNQWKNATAGFSITKYVSNNTAGATIGHGLGAVPELIIIKNLGDSDDWTVFHKSVGKNSFLKLNTDAMWETDSSSWNQTDPTNTVFTIGNSDRVNDGSSNEYIAYCWTPIPGFSSFGYYVGNGDSNGPVIHTGFKPKWLLVKRMSQAGENWMLMDSVRSPYNVVNKGLYASLNNAENTSDRLDYLANGWKLRTSSDGFNKSGESFVYAAFAEHPFKTARAV